MLKFVERQSTISEDQVLGNFSDLRKGCSVSVGKGPFGYYAVLVNADGKSVLISASKRLSKALNASLEGVTDAGTRHSIAAKAFDECNVLEIDATEATDDGTVGAVKHDSNDNPIKKYIAAKQGTSSAITEEQFNASVAKAGTFTIARAMLNRV